MVLYSDWSELQYDFSKTFRRQNKLETISSVKQRNREFYHWSRSLREVVEYYGNSGWNERYDIKYNNNCNHKRGPFFSGMSKVMIIPEIMVRLNGPCSTTKSIEVATRFAGSDGIIIQMDNQSYRQSHYLKCFDMNWISQYQGENEYLWIGGSLRIRIATIIMISTSNNYQSYFKSLYYFDAMITGTPINTMASVAEAEILLNLVSYRISPNESTCRYPIYIHETFRVYTNMKTQITLNMLDLQSVFMAIKDLIITMLGYNNKDNSYSINTNIYNLFPNLQSIIMNTAGYRGTKHMYNAIDIQNWILSIPRNITIIIKAKHHYGGPYDPTYHQLILKQHIGKSWLSKYEHSMTLISNTHVVSFQRNTV